MQQSAASLARFLEASRPLAVVTGAGVSTGSGIPDYRDADGNWKHARPVQFADFVGSAAARRRYWARSFAGWQRMRRAEPNDAHRAISALEASGIVDTLITQNVDGLHGRAGQRRVVDLHGRLDTVSCLDCGQQVSRERFQSDLAVANAGWQAPVSRVRPDGDAELEAADYDAFVVPDCERCGGIMKPDVVFFGESVPKQRVATAVEAVQRAAALLIVGSSLMVFSGFRFARLAHEAGKPLAIVNRGKTRADELATLKLDADCGPLLAQTVALLDGGPNARGLAM